MKNDEVDDVYNSLFLLQLFFLFLKKSCNPISRILLSAIVDWPSFICSRHCYRDVSAYPSVSPKKFRHRSEQLHSWPMWHFSMQGLPESRITAESRELLPHVFTFTRRMFYEEKPRNKFDVGSYSLWHSLLADFAVDYPRCYRVHCSLLSGLSYPNGSSESIAWLAAFFLKCKRTNSKNNY